MNIDMIRKQPARALRRVQDQISKVPNSSQFYLLLGQIELKNQNSAKAEEAFSKAVETHK